MRMDMTLTIGVLLTQQPQNLPQIVQVQILANKTKDQQLSLTEKN